MSRQQALHETLFKNYLLQHCLSWYDFARDIDVQVEFGDVTMLVTECSKTVAWASAVYSQSSKEFGITFSAGGALTPQPSPLDRKGLVLWSIGEASVSRVPWLGWKWFLKIKQSS